MHKYIYISVYIIKKFYILYTFYDMHTVEEVAGGPKWHSKSGRGIRKWHLYFIYFYNITVTNYQNACHSKNHAEFQNDKTTTKIFRFFKPSSITMSNNNPPRNNSDPGYYTFSIEPSENVKYFS